MQLKAILVDHVIQNFKFVQWRWFNLLVTFGNIAWAKKLLEKNADINIKDNDGNTALIEGNQIKAKELLDPFRKENKKQFDILLQQEYECVYPTARRICSIHYDVPDQDPFEDLEINTHLQDSRLLPVTQAGDTISRDFLKHYLEERLHEYLALGGLKELLDRRALILAEQKLPAPFYWDLWGNLEHLRRPTLSG